MACFSEEERAIAGHTESGQSPPNSPMSLQQLRVQPTIGDAELDGCNGADPVAPLLVEDEPRIAVEPGEEEVVLERQLEKEDVSRAEQSAGSLSLQGQLVEWQCEYSSLVIDIFNLDPIIQQVQEKTTNGEGIKLVNKTSHKGTCSRALTDRSLRSKSKLCSNSFSALSHD